MPRRHRTLWLGLLSGSLLAVPVMTLALETGLGFGSATGLSGRDIRETIGLIIQVALGLLGLVALACILYGGVRWMTAAGNEEHVTTAKATLRNCLIGLVIIMVSYSLTLFIFGALGGSGRVAGGGDHGGDIFPRGGGANDLIEYFYPTGRETGDDIPAKNIAIVISFRPAMDPAKLRADVDAAGQPLAAFTAEGKGSSVRIVRTATLAEGQTPEYLPATVSTTDNHTFKIRPTRLFPTPVDPTNYTVVLTCDITLADGSAAFSSESCTNSGGEGYSWSFNIADKLDKVPPFVTRPSPIAGQTVAMNRMVQVDFSEPMDPTTVYTATATAIATYTDNDGLAHTDEPIAGTVALSNGYRTMEFVPNTACEGQPVNSCGDPVYCFPKNAAITLRIKTSALADPAIAGLPFAARAGQVGDVFYPDGSVDLANNALFGNATGAPLQRADIPVAVPAGGLQDFVVQFATNATMDLTPPTMSFLTPRGEDLDLRMPVAAQFSKEMRTSKLNKENVRLQAWSAAGSGGAADPNSDVWYWLTSFTTDRNLQSVDDMVTSGADLETFADLLGNAETDLRTVSLVNHATFYGVTPYRTSYASGVQDVYYNCYVPAVCRGASCDVESPPGQCSGTGASRECSSGRNL